MRCARSAHPQQRTEATRIVIAKGCPIVEHDVDVIVGPPRRRRRVYAEASGHAKMHEQRIRAYAKQQILAATLDRFDGAAAEASSQIRGNWPAQAPVVHVQFRNMPADDM